jgi:hypothetical protein
MRPIRVQRSEEFPPNAFQGFGAAFNFQREPLKRARGPIILHLDRCARKLNCMGEIADGPDVILHAADGLKKR